MLAGSSVVVTLVVMPIAAVHSGWSGTATALFAWFVCLGPGLFSLGLVKSCREPQAAAQMALIGILPRIGVPLAVLMVVYFQGGVLVENGLVYYILVYYFANLIVETGLLAGSWSKWPTNTRAK